ncbi:hypothetical protein Dda_8952 [Drechslerella dactyloides]|uniref:Uncharacterized protein n=1 Tax=Drechslerella dactyloides TaxID=74499 RepID=A0AAD6NES2_DREDA|nr:hypothetical protein Dda_8952 [Drechslerella dactyloides]
MASAGTPRASRSIWDLSACTSVRTAECWHAVGSTVPTLLSLSMVITSTITVIVAIIINATIANKPDNDLGEGSGWIIMMPGTGATLLWSIISQLICKFGRFTPGLAIGSYVIIGLGLIVEAIWTILLYEWHDAAWLPAVFMFIQSIDACVFVIYGIQALRKGKVIKSSKNDFTEP